jgi:hypothetical protein
MTGLWAAAAGIAFAIALSAVAARFLSGIGVASFAVSAAISGVGLAILLLKIDGVTADPVAALLIYAFGCELYLFFSTLSLASISSSILAFLRENPATEDELAVRYSGWRMAEIRVERLVAADLIAPDGDRLRLTPRGRKIARTFHRLRSFFRHQPLRHFEATGNRSQK